MKAKLGAISILLPLVLAALGAAWLLARLADDGAPTQERSASGARLVSLAPAITETLFALGAGDRVVAVSDYCRYPSAVAGLPRAGSAITPNLELIARAGPTLILSERNLSARHDGLRRLAPTLALPWLTLADITGSVRELGQLVGRTAEAEALAVRLDERLSTKPPSDAPRLLLVIGNLDGKLGELWYIRDDSLHGAALRASGARNAAANEPPGPPRLPLDKLLEIDPDMIVVLDGSASPVASARFMAEIGKLTPLKAAREERVSVLRVTDPFVTGPRILELVDELSAEVKRLRSVK
jgi:iron complex transport system substrate-binding protein